MDEIKTRLKIQCINIHIIEFKGQFTYELFLMVIDILILKNKLYNIFNNNNFKYKTDDNLENMFLHNKTISFLLLVENIRNGINLELKNIEKYEKENKKLKEYASILVELSKTPTTKRVRFEI
jgi:hypothetical protein